MWEPLTSKQENTCSIVQKALGSTERPISLRDAPWLCRRSAGRQLPSLAALLSTERLFLLLRVWGLEPHSHRHHREKECAGLMMRRKSDKPHSHPSASIGHHWAPESPAHSKPLGPQKSMWKNSICIHSCSICMGTALLQSPLFHFFSHLCRGRRGLSELRH